ncbi:MAG: hypothetical protein ACE5I9_04095 [Candidatus Methylomirabilales bacterium]
MSAVPAKCLQCQRDLRYDPVTLRYRCPACDAPEETWRKRGEALGRWAARLLSKVERWLGT